MNVKAYHLVDYLPHIVPQAYAVGFGAGLAAAFLIAAARRRGTSSTILMTVASFVIAFVLIDAHYQNTMAKAAFADALDNEIRANS